MYTVDGVNSVLYVEVFYEGVNWQGCFHTLSFLVGAINTLFFRVSTTFVGFYLVVCGRRHQFGTYGSSKFAGDCVEVE